VLWNQVKDVIKYYRVGVCLHQTEPKSMAENSCCCGAHWTTEHIPYLNLIHKELSQVSAHNHAVPVIVIFGSWQGMFCNCWSYNGYNYMYIEPILCEHLRNRSSWSNLIQFAKSLTCISPELTAGSSLNYQRYISSNEDTSHNTQPFDLTNTGTKMSRTVIRLLLILWRI
jgi:hypothetical protein